MTADSLDVGQMTSPDQGAADPPEVVTLAEAERITALSLSTLRRRLRAGAIPGATRDPITGQWSIPRAGLAAAGMIAPDPMPDREPELAARLAATEAALAEVTARLAEAEHRAEVAAERHLAEVAAARLAEREAAAAQLDRITAALTNATEMLAAVRIAGAITTTTTHEPTSTVTPVRRRWSWKARP